MAYIASHRTFLREDQMSVLDPHSLEIRLGYKFRDPKLLRVALTHASFVENRLHSNERMEFLGDRVLGLIIAEMLCKEFRSEGEGQLGYRFTALARREALSHIALKINLGPHIFLSDGERYTGGATKPSVLANTCEAIIGALYLDGGLNAAQVFVARYWEPLLKDDTEPRKDPKTALQEWAQASGKSLPSYSVIQCDGPDHAPIFTVEVIIDDELPARGRGSSKRTAEQSAAATILQLLSPN